MLRSPELPLFPGNSIKFSVNQTHFPKPHFLKIICDGVTDVLSKTPADRYPSVYSRGEVIESPPWIVYDKKILTFEAFYKEGINGQFGYNYVVHNCKIFFFLEDGTIKVVEPKVRNSGIPQGCLISRQRIRYPKNGNYDDFYDILDFNIGKTVDFFGKVFLITNCDKFTRSFLNRLGIPVPEAVPAPEDPYIALRNKADKNKKIKQNYSTRKNFLEFIALEGQILCFDGYWDDRETEGGYLHLIKIYYYLSDETIEVKDITDKKKKQPLVKRCKLPKKSKGLLPNATHENTILNVMGETMETSWSIQDPLNLGKDDTEFFRDNDLIIGATLNAYGKKIVLIDCDDFTKDFYRAKYGLDDFTPVKRPLTKEESEMTLDPIKLELPPFNGFGSHEDSAINCKTIVPVSTIKSYKQFYEKDREGYDSKILRFSAALKSDEPYDEFRVFTISYYLVDDTISVFEISQKNSGMKGGSMIGRRKITKPGENIYGSKPPECYRAIDLFIGNIVDLERFKFELKSADEYTLRYMELHSNEFPLSNIDIILTKLREVIRPFYKSFVANYLQETSFPSVSYKKFSSSLKQAVGDFMTEHEYLTLARFCSARDDDEQLSLDRIKSIVHDDLRRQLYNDFDRLRELFLHYDKLKNGRVSQVSGYNALRGGRVPLDPELIKTILERLTKDDELIYDELLHFLNYEKNISPSFLPISVADSVSWSKSKTTGNTKGNYVDLEKFIRSLNLEKEIVEQ